MYLHACRLLDAVSESNACEEAHFYVRKLLDRERITLEEYLKVCQLCTLFTGCVNEYVLATVATACANRCNRTQTSIGTLAGASRDFE